MLNGKIDFINEKSKLIVFSPHIFFPQGMIITDLFRYLKQLERVKFFLIVSSTIYSNNKERFDELVGCDKDSMIIRSGEPTLEDVKQGEERIKLNSYDFILAVGGGSVLDLAKSIKEKLDIPLIVAPTTPATGSEATPYSVIIDQINRTKTIINSKSILPEVVIIDSSFAGNIPKEQLGLFIMDILAHSLEAMASKKSNELSDAFSFESLRIIFNNYDKLNFPYDKKNIEAIFISGFLGGLAQNMAAVGLIHSFSHYFGPKHNISHSKAVSLFIESVLKFNMEKSDRYNKLDSTNIIRKDELINHIKKIKTHFGIVDKKIILPKYFDREQAIQEIRKDVCSITNPVLASKEGISSIIDECCVNEI